MAKMTFKVNVNRHVLGTQENFKINKENDMTNYKRNERNPNDGSGIPDMPVMQFDNERPDPLDLLKIHMIQKHGEAEGLKLLKAMSALDALRTLEEIKNSEQTTGIAFRDEKSGYEQYSMPKMEINGGKKS